MKSIKFVFLKAIIIVSSTFGASSIYSQNSPGNYVKTEIANKIQFVGVDENNYLLFDLRLTELPAKGCTLQIMDDAGNTLLEEIILANSFARRYKIARDGSSKISFKATGKRFAFNQSFSIKTEVHFTVTTE